LDLSADPLADPPDGLLGAHYSAPLFAEDYWSWQADCFAAVANYYLDLPVDPLADPPDGLLGAHHSAPLLAEDYWAWQADCFAAAANYCLDLAADPSDDHSDVPLDVNCLALPAYSPPVCRCSALPAFSPPVCRCSAPQADWLAEPLRAEHYSRSRGGSRAHPVCYPHSALFPLAFRFAFLYFSMHRVYLLALLAVPRPSLLPAVRSLLEEPPRARQLVVSAVPEPRKVASPRCS
jgi:hypothetical protein